MVDATDKPRDLRRELTNALRQCTPKQRRYLERVRAAAGQKWAMVVRTDPKTAAVFSSNSLRKWLRMEHVQRVLALHAQMAELDSDLTAERIIREYERLAFSDMRSMYNEDGSLKRPHEWSDAAAAAVQGFDEKGRPKFHDKRGALDNAARIRGVLVDKQKHEHSGPNGAPIRTRTETVIFPNGGPGQSSQPNFDAEPTPGPEAEGPVLPPDE